MDPLQLREKEVFEALKSIRGASFALIGVYAANAYALPRFSIDCDIVVGDNNESERIGGILKKAGYGRTETGGAPYGGRFERYERELEGGFKVSVDLLIKEILDRQTGAVFSAEWVFKNSKNSELKGKTIQEKLRLRIISLDALFAMKAVSARATDIRDIFMLAPKIHDAGWVKEEIAKRSDLAERFSRIMRIVNSKQFRDGLQGVYGHVDDSLFEKHKRALAGIGD